MAKRKDSFAERNSYVRTNESGELARPMHHRMSQNDPGMSDKLHSLMATYIPRDMESIEKS